MSEKACQCHGPNCILIPNCTNENVKINCYFHNNPGTHRKCLNDLYDKNHFRKRYCKNVNNSYDYGYRG